MVEENVMIKKLIKYYLLGESLKEIELNRILDKISRKKSIDERERNFLKLYQITREEEMKDFMLLSKNTTAGRIVTLIENGKNVICDLYDKNGKIGLIITKIENDYEEEFGIITMKGGEKHRLLDKYLYNIIYNAKKDNYSLQEHDEYIEKIEASNDEN
jgi:hypothetical protein